MKSVTPRRPLRDQELERFDEITEKAKRISVTHAEFLTPQVNEERDVLIYCLRGPVPGKRYRYEAGWLDAFKRDSTRFWVVK